MNNNIKLKPSIRDFLDNHADWWGVKIVYLLFPKPEERFHVCRMSQILDPPDYPAWQLERLNRMLEHANGIPQTDYQTLRDIDKRLERLIATKAELMTAQLDYAYIDKETDALVDYRNETTRPNGNIKNFRQDVHREIQRHRKAFLRLLKAALIECPEAYYYLKAHVQTGLYYMWISDVDDEPAGCDQTRTNKKSTRQHFHGHRRC